MQAWTHKPIGHHELAQLTDGDLRSHWAATFRRPAPNVTREILLLSLAYGLQETADGSLPTRVRRLLRDGARELMHGRSKSRAGRVELAIGTELAREWQGTIYRVVVTADGFMMDARLFSSLTEAARHIVGYNYPGPRFFGLRRRRLLNPAVTGRPIS